MRRKAKAHTALVESSCRHLLPCGGHANDNAHPTTDAALAWRMRDELGDEIVKL